MALKNDYTAGVFLAAFSANAINSSAGPTWATIGSTEEGWTIEREIHEQDVHDDRFGDGVADTVDQGTDQRVTGVMLNLTAANLSGVFASHQSEGQTNNNVGKLGSFLYGSLCLTPVALTPAAALIGAGKSYVFGLAAIGNNINMLLASKLRKIPVTFKVLPDQNNGNLAYSIINTPAGVPSTYP